ncbi:Imm32 family immunity protein [Planotetraspora silvatica]
MELSGTRSELRALSRSLRNEQGGCGFFENRAPFPYSRSLSGLEFRETSEDVVCIAADGPSLKIHGGRMALDLLAENIEGFASEADHSDHLHIEYFPGHDYLSQDSEPLVIAIYGD